MYAWAAAMARQMDALYPETAEIVLLIFHLPLIAMIPAILALRSASRWRRTPSVPNRVELVIVRIVTSSVGLASAAGLLLVFLGWFTVLLYIRIVFQLEIGRGYLPGVAKTVAGFFTVGPAVGAGVAVWGLVTLWHACKHVKGLQQA